MKVNSITEPVTLYTPSTSSINENTGIENLLVYPNPTSDLIAVQLTGINPNDRKITLLDAQGRKILEQYIYQGSTIGYFDISTLYDGTYFIRLEDNKNSITKQLQIHR